MKNLFSIFSNSTSSFEGKHDDETVLLCLHRHWYTLLGKFIYFFLGGLLPFVLIALFGQLIIKYNLNALVVFLWSAYYLILWYILGYTVTMYTMDIWVVTTQRIIDSTQNGFFNRTVSEISLGNIQDTSTVVMGAIPTTMNYGDIEVQSAGAQDHFDFKQVPNPQGVKEVITKAIANFKHEHFKDEAIEVVKDVEEARDQVPQKESPAPENLPQ